MLYLYSFNQGQRTDDIRVCAQQEYSLNSKSHVHDDCYPIKQNVQKTYLYSIFDYGQIDGFEGAHWSHN
jgi:hypothetical protein